MRLLLIGPPGSGKGTQAARIAEKFGIPTISTGEIFRKNVAAGTELGRLADGLMKAGKYVPDEVTNALVANRLAEPDAAEGFLLDGYPRTLAQVDALDEMLTKAGTQLDVVVELTVNDDEVVTRLLKRATLEGRADDNEETIRARQRIYAEQTEPLVSVYGGRGLLVRVDGMGELDEITERLVSALSSIG